MPVIEMAGFAAAPSSTPLIEMAAFANRKYRPTVSRLVPNSRRGNERSEAYPIARKPLKWLLAAQAATGHESPKVFGLGNGALSGRLNDTSGSCFCLEKRIYHHYRKS